MAPSTPTTTPHGSATATHHAYPMLPTATDIPSQQALFHTWSERVVAEDSFMATVAQEGGGASESGTFGEQT
eukprot:scaffold173422_cov41-Attheya_sp.AAC.1